MGSAHPHRHRVLAVLSGTAAENGNFEPAAFRPLSQLAVQQSQESRALFLPIAFNSLALPMARAAGTCHYRQMANHCQIDPDTDRSPAYYSPCWYTDSFPA